MKVVLEVTSGPNAPRSFVIERGTEVQVGRQAPAQIVLAHDRSVSRRHFALKFDGEICRIRDLGSSHGTTVNGRPVSAAIVVHNDLITVGSSVLRVVITDDHKSDVRDVGFEATLPIEPAAIPAAAVETQEHEVIAATLHDRVLEVLRSQKEPLFAILDAARDSLVLARLLNCQEKYESLYEGPEADKLMAVAPYLVAPPPDSEFLSQLVHEGWGKSWGVYLTCDRSFEETRKHLRRFLTVEIEDGTKLLFRFYDPRVLRVYLPTCTSAEVSEFFGPLTGFLMEAEDPAKLLIFSRDQQATKPTEVYLPATTGSLR
jgi:hypothetical protein